MPLFVSRNTATIAFRLSSLFSVRVDIIHANLRHKRDKVMTDTGTTERASELSADIRLLGNLLGDVIRQQHGEDAFELVERVRADAKARRHDDALTHNTSATKALGEFIAGLNLEQKRVLIKAFSNY